MHIEGMDVEDDEAIAKLLSIVRELAGMPCPIVHNPLKEICECWYCSADYPVEGMKHSDNCIWRRAQEFKTSDAASQPTPSSL